MFYSNLYYVIYGRPLKQYNRPNVSGKLFCITNFQQQNNVYPSIQNWPSVDKQKQFVVAIRTGTLLLVNTQPVNKIMSLTTVAHGKYFMQCVSFRDKYQKVSLNPT